MANVALTHADIATAHQAHNTAIAGMTASGNRLNGHITGELMPRAKGDYAVALMGLETRRGEIHADSMRNFQEMSDLLPQVSAKNAALDAERSSHTNSLLGFLNA